MALVTLFGVVPHEVAFQQLKPSRVLSLVIVKWLSLQLDVHGQVPKLTGHERLKWIHN